MKYKELKYLRLRTGRDHQWFKQFYKDNYIAVGFGLDIDLSDSLFDNWRDFNKKFIPTVIDKNPGKSRIAAGLNCGVIWTLSKGVEKDAIILCQDEDKNYHPCRVVSNYFFSKEDGQYHRRKVEWFDKSIKISDMSSELIRSLTAQNTLIDISKYKDEIDELITGSRISKISVSDPTIEEPSEFALERHLEDFLIKNWKSTSLGKNFDIYEEEGEMVGQQYPSDTGPIDILAISKDKKTLLVVELKKGRVSDNVVGQIQRYMGYVKSDLAEKNQDVKGVIIGLEDDLKLTRALSVTRNIDFYKYKVNFKLYK